MYTRNRRKGQHQGTGWEERNIKNRTKRNSQRLGERKWERTVQKEKTLKSCVTIMPALLMPAMQRKSHLCIPRKVIARPQSQFLHSCVCERDYIFPGSVHIFSCCRIGGPIMGLYKSLTDTLSVKWTSFYVLQSGGHKCNSLWPVG